MWLKNVNELSDGEKSAIRRALDGVQLKVLIHTFYSQLQRISGPSHINKTIYTYWAGVKKKQTLDTHGNEPGLNDTCEKLHHHQMN